MAQTRLSRMLNSRIEEMSTDRRSRSDIIRAMARAAGIDESTVNNILSGNIKTPPLSRLRGFARVLRIALSRLESAAGLDNTQERRRRQSGRS